MSPVIDSLPVLVVYPHSRCNCRCLMCDIWKAPAAQEISAEELERHCDSIEHLGVQWIVFSGGEPLMHSDLFRLCAIVRERGIRVTVLSSGLLLRRHARSIVDHVDDVIVSLDGPAEIHDRIRRVRGAFEALAAGVDELHSLRNEFPVAGRCTVQRANCGHLLETMRTARRIGLKSISFLAVDTSSGAFNHPTGWSTETRDTVALGLEDLPIVHSAVDALVASGECGAFVAEAPEKLSRLVDHFRAECGLTAPVAPRCNAPWIAAVLEAGGSVRPCFFHEPIGRVDSSKNLAAVVNSDSAVRFRASLDIETNPVCRRCVCALDWKS